MIDYNKRLISPSTDPVPLNELNDYVKDIKFGGADLLHCDVMDGEFVTRKTYDQKVVSVIRRSSPLPLDVHLMVEKPHKKIKKYAELKPEFLTIEYEAFYKARHLVKALKILRRYKVKGGLAIGPRTSVAVLVPFLGLIDVALVMGVEPGMSGQAMDPMTVHKVAELDLVRRKYKANLFIEVDGGVNPQNSNELYEAGANSLVSGSYVYNSLSRRSAINRIKGEDLGTIYN